MVHKFSAGLFNMASAGTPVKRTISGQSGYMQAMQMSGGSMHSQFSRGGAGGSQALGSPGVASGVSGTGYGQLGREVSPGGRSGASSRNRSVSPHSPGDFSSRMRSRSNVNRLDVIAE